MPSCSRIPLACFRLWMKICFWKLYARDFLTCSIKELGILNYHKNMMIFSFCNGMLHRVSNPSERQSDSDSSSFELQRQLRSQ